MSCFPQSVRLGAVTRRLPAILLGVAALACNLPAHAELRCVIEPEQTADIGAPVIGVLEKVLVQRGDKVRRGQVIAKMTTAVELRAVELARARLKALNDVGSAEVNAQFAQRKYERTQSLVEQGFISAQAVDQAGTEANLAHKKLAQTLSEKTVYENELELSTAQYELRLIRSPIDGVVVDTFISAGERVEEKPIVRVSSLNPLRVESVLPSQHYGHVALGMHATVTPELPGAEPRAAVVTLIDPVIDASSNTFRIRLKLDNDVSPLPAGLRCGLAVDGVDLQTKPRRAAAEHAVARPPGASNALSVSVR